MIAVVHTFGSNIRFNPHVHALIPEIKTRGKEVMEMGYLDYEYLKKIWQYNIDKLHDSCIPDLNVTRSGIQSPLPHKARFVAINPFGPDKTPEG